MWNPGEEHIILTDVSWWELIAKAATGCFRMVLNYATYPLTENTDTSWEEPECSISLELQAAPDWLGFSDQESNTKFDVSLCEDTL